MSVPRHLMMRPRFRRPPPPNPRPVASVVLPPVIEEVEVVVESTPVAEPVVEVPVAEPVVETPTESDLSSDDFDELTSTLIEMVVEPTSWSMDMRKADLLAIAAQRSVSVNETMTKTQIIAALDASLP